MDLATIENHCHFIKSDGCLTKIYYHSILNLKLNRSVAAILTFAFFDVLQIPTNQVMIRSVLSKFNWLSIIQRSTVQQRPSFLASFEIKYSNFRLHPDHWLNLNLRRNSRFDRKTLSGRIKLHELGSGRWLGSDHRTVGAGPEQQPKTLHFQHKDLLVVLHFGPA